MYSVPKNLLLIVLITGFPLLLWVSCGKNAPNSDELIKYSLPLEFPEDFPPQYDSITGKLMSGWGGGPGDVRRNPVIFVHGNGHNANNWRILASVFLDSGYVPAELWALSYIDFNGGDSANSNLANTGELNKFVKDVLDYTQAGKVDMISHSLGVTVSRAWMKQYDSYQVVSHFIGIAGPNHGVAYCSNDSISAICRELGNPESSFLVWLNHPDETPHDDLVKYMTIFDGTGVDIFYIAACIMNDGSIVDLRYSPVLDGAENVQIPGVDHFNLPNHPESIKKMLEFLRN